MDKQPQFPIIDEDIRQLHNKSKNNKKIETEEGIKKLRTHFCHYPNAIHNAYEGLIRKLIKEEDIEI